MSLDIPKPPRSKEVAHDETPSQVVDHPFEPRGEWWSLCKHCNLAESAHRDTTIKFRYVGDDMADDD
jgi:hypothetical protein